MKHLKVLCLLTLVAALAVLGACGGSDDPDTGTVQLALTDAVNHNFSEVVIAIKEVRAVPAGGEGSGEGGLPMIVRYETPLTVNVLDLAFQQQLLGEAVLPAGTYSQLRLVLEKNDPLAPANYIVLADNPGVKVPIDTPSGQQSGLKVVGKFTVGAGEITAVILDFDPARALVETPPESGNWIFKPTGIRVVQTDEVLLAYGAIAGQVAQDVTDATGTVQVPVTEATAYAIPEGLTEALAAGPVNTEDGSFRLFLPPGAYELKVSAGGFEAFSTLPAFFTVETGVDTFAGTIVLEPVSAQ
jgi:hypothetical protein